MAEQSQHCLHNSVLSQRQCWVCKLAEQELLHFFPQSVNLQTSIQNLTSLTNPAQP